MIPEIGQLALALALCLALAQSSLGLAGAARGDSVWMSATRPAARGQFAFVAIAFGCLTYAFVANDFTVAYVASNSNSALPLAYRVSGVWGGHEGSMLLWILMLGVWTVGVTLFSHHLPEEMVARVLGVMGLVSTGFLLFILFTSNPFLRVFPGPADGRDLNPLLQDPGMVLHPPMLYMGYVGFSIAFSFAVAALISGRLDAAWARCRARGRRRRGRFSRWASRSAADGRITSWVGADGGSGTRWRTLPSCRGSSGLR